MSRAAEKSSMGRSENWLLDFAVWTTQLFLLKVVFIREVGLKNLTRIVSGLSHGESRSQRV